MLARIDRILVGWAERGISSLVLRRGIPVPVVLRDCISALFAALAVHAVATWLDGMLPLAIVWAGVLLFLSYPLGREWRHHHDMTGRMPEPWHAKAYRDLALSRRERLVGVRVLAVAVFLIVFACGVVAAGEHDLQVSDLSGLALSFVVAAWQYLACVVPTDDGTEERPLRSSGDLLAA